jgi:hypothetical protein
MLGIDHDFSSNGIKQAALDEGAYDALFDFALYFGYRGCIERTGRVKDDAGIGGFVVATRFKLLPGTRMMATSDAGSVPINSALSWRPSCKVTMILSALSIT